MEIPVIGVAPERNADKLTEPSQRTHDAIMTSLLRQNNVATSFWRNNDVVIASCAHSKIVDSR